MNFVNSKILNKGLKHNNEHERDYVEKFITEKEIILLNDKE